MVPPLACKACEYVPPTVTVEDGVNAVILRGLAATTIEVVADAVCAGRPLSVAVTVKVEVPLTVGVPDKMPVALASVSPVGRLPDLTDHV